MRKLALFITLLALLTKAVTPFCSQAVGERKLKVFSWWASGGEVAALGALLNVYKKQNPGVEIINATVAGGAGFAARAVLQTRLAGGKPPDSWQTHPGRELLDQYVGSSDQEAGRLCLAAKCSGTILG
jgi:ABC-type glycerol-3-phosphate transport system substrate-binding protein